MRKKQRKSYVVGYVRPLPRLTGETQLRALEPVCDRIVTEGARDGALIGSLALLTETLLRDTVLAVYKLRLLADPRAPSRQRSLDRAMDAIEARGTETHPVVIWEVSTDLRSDTRKSRDTMVRGARDDIQRANRDDEAGRPPIAYTDEQMDVLRRHWFDMRHATNEIARDAIRAEARARKIPLIGGLSVQSIGKRTLLGPSGRGRVKRKPKTK